MEEWHQEEMCVSKPLLTDTFVQIPPRTWEPGVAQKVTGMLAELGFEAVPEPSRKGKGKHKKGGTTGLVWRQPYSLELLHLDRAALKLVAARWGPGQASCISGNAFCRLKTVPGKAGNEIDKYVLKYSLSING